MIEIEIGEAAGAMLDAFYGVLATGLIHGTLLAIITAVLAVTVFRRARPAIMAALWIVVLVKFVVPVGPEVPVSLSGLIDLVMQPGESAAITAPATVAHTPQATRAAMTGEELAWLLGKLAVMAVYLGLVFWLSWRRVRAHRARRRWAEGLAAAGAGVRAIAGRAARKVGIRRLPALRVTSAVTAPQLVGVIRPILIVPAQLAGDEPVLEATLLHELAHLRRRDTWLRGLQVVVGTVMFFWPIVHWVNRRIDDHREMACDQWAIACGKLDPGQYARTLVRLARHARLQRRRVSLVQALWIAPVGVTLGMALSGRKHQLEARVDALMRGARRPRLGVLPTAGLAMWALVSLGGAASARAPMSTGPAECVIEPGVLEYIMATHPEADADGDGELSREEVCAYQRLLRERGVRDDAQDAADAGVAGDEPLASFAPDMEMLECAACGICDDMTLGDAVLDKKMCSAEPGELR